MRKATIKNPQRKVEVHMLRKAAPLSGPEKWAHLIIAGLFVLLAVLYGLTACSGGGHHHGLPHLTCDGVKDDNGCGDDRHREGDADCDDRQPCTMPTPRPAPSPTPPLPPIGTHL